MKQKKLRLNEMHLFFCGLILLVLAQIPTIVLGTGAIVPYHDQLDGEVIAYMYQAKYLFDNIGIIPEFLSGAPKTALVPPAPLAVVFFAVFSPFVAYNLLCFFAQLCAYIGMFFLCMRVTGHKYIALMVALLYMFIPFLPVYGLTHYGAPLLLLSFWELYNKRNIFVSYICIMLYAAMSSFVLVGFAWIGVGFVFSLVILLSKSRQKHFHLPIAVGVMTVVYFLENFTLIAQTLGFAEGFISHKADYQLTATPLLIQIWSNLKDSGYYMPDSHGMIIPIVVGAVMLFVTTLKKQSAENKKIFYYLVGDIAFIVIIAVLAAVSETSYAVEMRQNMGALGSFNISRMLWMLPAFWYIALAISVTILWNCIGKIRWISYVYSSLLLLVLGFVIMKSSFIKPCLQEILLPDYDNISWSDYYALGVMDQVEAFIKNEEGLQIEEYKVASLAIDPCAALYHGFYCIDGYSNNYPLEYKTKFRTIIEKEIDKSEYLRSYFDAWGNRCYLLSAELPGYYNVEKGSFYYVNLELNTKALKEMGCDYILSAAYIIPNDSMDVTLLREEPFSTEDSYYNIYIYRVN